MYGGNRVFLSYNSPTWSAAREAARPRDLRKEHLVACVMLPFHIHADFDNAQRGGAAAAGVQRTGNSARNTVRKNDEHGGGAPKTFRFCAAELLWLGTPLWLGRE